MAYSKTTQTIVDETTPAHRRLHSDMGSLGGTPSQDWWEDEEGAGLRAPNVAHPDEVATDSDLSPTAGLPPALAGLVSNLVRSAEVPISTSTPAHTPIYPRLHSRVKSPLRYDTTLSLPYFLSSRPFLLARKSDGVSFRFSHLECTASRVEGTWHAACMLFISYYFLR